MMLGAINQVAITVSNLDKSLNFYQPILRFWATEILKITQE